MLLLLPILLVSEILFRTWSNYKLRSDPRLNRELFGFLEIVVFKYPFEYDLDISMGKSNF